MISITSIVDWLLVLLSAFVPVGSPGKTHLPTNEHAQRFAGNGLKIAILDLDFSGDRTFLPIDTIAKSFQSTQSSATHTPGHGTKCAQVINQYVPKAQFYLVSWERDSQASFLKALNYLREQKVDLICCSVNVPAWGYPGQLEFQQQVSQLMAGITFVASAGNFGQRHWESKWRGAAFHEWSAKQTCNRLRPWVSDQNITIEYAAQGSRAKILITDDSGHEVQNPIMRPNSAGGYSYRFTVTRPYYNLQLKKCQPNDQPENVKLFVLGAEIEYSTAENSLAFPATLPNAIAVGACNRAGKLETYSGRDNCKAIVMARVPFLLVENERFDGTSAAAPQIAGVIARLKSFSKNAQPVACKP